MRQFAASTASIPTASRSAVSSAHRASAKPGAAADNATRQNARETSELRALFEAHSFEQHFQPGSTILLHAEPADSLYLVVSGTVRCCTIDATGNRQIFSFPKKGEVVGLSDMDHWHFTAEAVDHVILKCLPKSRLEQTLAVNAALRREIGTYLRGLIAERERQLLMMSTARGPERLYRFLEDFAATRSAKGHVVLPMCRRDIGDHIGLSMESVSRAFGDLKRKGLIDLKSHEKYRINPNATGLSGPGTDAAMPGRAALQ